MLSQSEFIAWCNYLNLPQQTQQLIEQIRSSDPSRRVGGGRKNVAGRYPSQKMGFTIQFESHKVELAHIYQLEHDEDVLEYYDQPPPIKLNYQGKNGRQLGVVHTPDYFVIRGNSAGWEECKTESELKKLSQKSPNRYVFTDGKWRSPPGENYAQSLGLNYHLWSDNSINWILQGNLVFLEDYYRAENLTIPESTANIILEIVTSQPGITITELLTKAETIKTDDIYTLIATEQLYINLQQYSLTELDKCPLFPDIKTAKAYILMKQSPSSPLLPSSLINLTIGTTLLWDSKAVNIIHIGNSEITLRDEDEKFIVLKLEEIEALIKQGTITYLAPQTPSINSEAWEQFYQASPEDQSEALRRYQVIEPYLRGEKRENETTSARTIRDWKAKYLNAQQKYGCGYVGLLSHRQKKGNRSRKLPQASLDLMNEFITNDYETLKQKRMWSVYCSLLKACEQKGLIVPSYKTFTLEVKKRSSYEQTKKRQGRRAAYNKETFYWELQKTTPKHGSRPLEIAHIDHTELDVELVCSQTSQNLGRPWATFLVDAYSRRLLAVYLTFDSPSYRSCLMALRLCVQRNGRLPQTIVVDNGAEFHSVYFETLLATFECTKKHRPAAKGRFGAVCERLFGTSNTQFVDNLLGNTQIMKNVRQVTKSVNPKKHAVWTLGRLYETLCAWAYDVYDTLNHPALGQSPREAFALGMIQGGTRNHKIIPYDDNFQILTLPTTSTGKAKVQPSMGIKINYIYYWANIFRDPEIEKTYVPIRYDPFDAGIAYAYVRGFWVKCTSQYFADFQGRSEKEIKLATKELIKRFSNHQKKSKVSAKKLAEFLTSVQAEEVLLQQRQRDMEAKDVFQVINGGHANQNPIFSSIATDVASSTLTDTTSSIAEDTLPDNLEIYEEF
ncbi:DDE-type integrase/transposase/recombinase [Cyanothece sp. BG0011]|uniref:TnsA endonuclease C-terminal domain-containing protein n=1 Tax=Cyanothece sp. BG0011 TaxID=2082950 RepID=UPI000D1DBC93|nr:DDE-type integrase/transposase/recombinase [Cyanothece sp. BG0011]